MWTELIALTPLTPVISLQPPYNSKGETVGDSGIFPAGLCLFHLGKRKLGLRSRRGFLLPLLQVLLPLDYLWKSDQLIPSIFNLFTAVKPFDKRWGPVNKPLHHVQLIGPLLTTTPFLWSYKAINNGISPGNPRIGLNYYYQASPRALRSPSLSLHICMGHCFPFSLSPHLHV